MLRWLPLGVFGVPWACFVTTLDSLWLPLGCPWAPLRRPGKLVGPLVGGLGAFGSLSDAFGLPLAVLCDLFRRPGVPVGSLWAPWNAFGHLLDLIENRSSQCAEIIIKQSNIQFLPKHNNI